MVNTALRTKWEIATSKLPWGVHRVFKEAFNLVANEQIKMVWGADVRDGSPCLVNSVHSMLSDKTLSPSSAFPEVVSLFDQINRELRADGINSDSLVSPMAAEILLRWFAPEPPKPTVDPAVFSSPVDIKDGNFTAITPEPSDEQLANDWLNMLKVEAAREDFKICERKSLDNEDAKYIAWCNKKGLNPNERRENADGYWDEFWAEHPSVPM
jgi:hypothetical protein